MTAAVKFVDDGTNWYLEGLGLPFYGPVKASKDAPGGRDLTGTYFDPDTNFCLDWYPDGAARPTLYGHGLDGELGPSVVGRVVSYKMTDKGIWTKTQLDKAHAYAENLRELAEAGVLHFSSGAVDHLVQVDPSNGAIKQWPWVEQSIVVNPANPEASLTYSVKSTDAIEHLLAVGVEAPEQLVGVKKDVDKGVGGGVDRDKLPDEDFAGPNRTFPIVKPGDVSDAASLVGHAANPDEVKAAIIRIAKRKGPSFVAELPKSWREDDGGKSLDLGGVKSSYDAAVAAGILQSLLYLRGSEAGETTQVAALDDAISAMQRFISSEAAENDDFPSPLAAGMASMDRIAVKAGARNSAADLKLIQSIHDSAASLGAQCDDMGAGKAADVPPADVLGVKSGDAVEPMSGADLDALRARLADLAVKEAHRILRP